jgi:hypothetical protein
MSETVRYPAIKVRLTGKDGNAFSILGNVVREMRRHGVETRVIDQFQEEAMSGDYDHLLQTCMKWVDVS